MCYLRFVKTRSVAHRLIEQGHVRRNGARVSRASQPITEGDVLTFLRGKEIMVARICALPVRRGPPAEAQLCYQMLDPQAESAIAIPANSSSSNNHDQGPAQP